MPEPQKTLLLRKITDFIFIFFKNFLHALRNSYFYYCLTRTYIWYVDGYKYIDYYLYNLSLCHSAHICAFILESERSSLKLLFLVFASDGAPGELFTGKADEAKNSYFFEKNREIKRIIVAFYFQSFFVTSLLYRM